MQRLRGGKLQSVILYPKNEADNISYSNSAPVQYMVIDGKLYTPNQGDMASTGYYYFNVSDAGIELPCTYTLYCKPGSPEWDMQMSMYVHVAYSGGSASEQLVGSATVKKPGASITALSTSVCSDLVYVNGTARPNTTVSIYDGETLIGTATANSKGVWGAKVPLANTDSEYASTHVLTSRTDKARSEDFYVFHDPNGPELTGFRMSWKEYGRDYGINVGEGYTYHGRMEQVTFTATLDKTLYSSVAAAEVLFDPILNNRPAKDGVYALTATDLAEYADALNATQNAPLFSDTVDLRYTAGGEDLAGINAKYAGTGMEIQAFAVDYNDETGFLKWMNDSAAAWTSGNREANTVGVYNKSVVFADKADYDAQLAQLKAYATWQSALASSNSGVTGGQFFFTDMKYDADLNLTDEGTYVAEFNTFCDTGRKLYAIIGALALDSSFRQYATSLPDNVATLAKTSGSRFGNATVLWNWGNEASKPTAAFPPSETGWIRSTRTSLP